MFCALLATFSLCVGILQFVSVEIFTFSFSVGIIHMISVEHFYGAKILGEGGGCCSDKENDRRRLWGPRHAPVALRPNEACTRPCSKNTFCYRDLCAFGGPQILPSKGPAHTAPALCKNTLLIILFTFGPPYHLPKA